MSQKARIRYFIIKLIVFSILAVLVFIFRADQLEHLRPFIGVIMVLYGVEEILFEVLNHKKRFYHEGKVYLGLVELIIGIVLLCADLKFEYVCIIWATWSIVRESYEIKEIVIDIKSLIPCILSGVESVAVIVFSILLINEPGEHHASIHISLLILELILSPLVMLLDELIQNHKNKKKEQQIEEQ